MATNVTPPARSRVGASIVGRALLIGVLAGLVSPLVACSGQEPDVLSVQVVLSTCGDGTCFLAPVPDAKVVITAGGKVVKRKTTNSQGTMTVSGLPSGDVDITARWGGQSAYTTVPAGAADTTVTLGLPGRATIAETK